MSKLRKKLIGVLAVLFCALLTLSTALIIPKTKTAAAYTSEPSTAISELYNGAAAQYPFSASKLRKLYSKLADDDKVKNLKDLDTKLNITTSGVNSVASKNVIVEFGGMKWTAVYLSKATTEYASVGGAPAANTLGEAANEDIVLTLWLTNPTQTAKFNSSYDSSTFTTCTYASNMYGTSYMRTYVLNNGGYYWQDRENLTQTPHAQQSDNPYAHFTMTNPNNGNESVVDYLVSPRYIKWQYMQSAKPDHYSYEVNNDSWGKGDKDNFFSKNNMKWYYADKFDGQPTDYYSIWKDDLIWLPSVTEAGSGTGTNSCGTNGMWNTTREQRLIQSTATCPWLRSADEQGYKNVFCVDGTTGDSSSGYFFMLVDSSRLVRPAIHLNLTEASKAAKGVSYDAVNPVNVDESSKNVANTEKGHIFTHTYDGNKVEVELLDRANLKIVGDDYSQSSGKFTVEYPEQKPDASDNGDKTYTITVEPDTDYVWDDTDQGGTREYKITVSLAKITLDPLWGDTTCALGESLLPDTTAIKVKGTESTPTVVYYVAEPTASPPDVSTWETEDVGDFTAAKTGKNRVHYQISADFHNNLKGYYDVTVNADSEITLTGSIDDTTTKYGDETAEDLLALLKDKFDGVTFKGDKSGEYDSTRVASLWDDMQIVLYSDGKEVSPQSNGYYAAGTYEVYLKYKNNSLSFKWNLDHPKVTIDKKPISVKIVAKDGGDLTHIYGDTPVTMTLEAVDKSDFVGNAEVKDDETSLGKVTFKTDKGTLTNLIAAGDYRIDADIIEVNYTVELLSKPQYTVKPRAITLKVVDETVGYGTDLVNHKFKDMELQDGKIISGSGVSLDSLTESAKYYLLINDAKVELSNDLAIKVYDLCAEVTTDNYDITVVAGKLTITTANFDMNDVSLSRAGYIYDGKPHPAQLNGDLPSDEITVSYRYVNYDTGEEIDGAPVEVGLYIVYATFTHSNSNYNPITDVLAGYIRIAYSQDELNVDYPPLPTDAELAAAADLAKKKAEAKKTLDEEAQAKKDAIDADTNLSAEEKKAAKDEIDKELKEGNAAIDKATDKDGVDKAYGDGKKEMEDTTELVQKKGAAKSELDKAAQAKKEAIDNNPDLTDEEKAAAKAEVDKELAKGKAEIDGATDVGGIQSVESSTKANIENIKPEHKGNFPWWILAVIAGAIILLTVIIIVVVKRRNADDDDGGYDDYYDDEYDYDEEEESDDGDEAFEY